jgi:aarF domain-containing kinase
MDGIVSAFSYQIFATGFVHADPHPGNIIIRKSPKTGKTQVCLLDHGLYVTEDEGFRREYCQFWKALFTMDQPVLQSLATKWGIADVNLFASATLQRPYNPKKAVHLGSQTVTMKDVYEMQTVSKERVKKLLTDTEKIPRELIFLGRNLNLVRSYNKFLGSPVNRVNIMARWAVRDDRFDDIDGISTLTGTKLPAITRLKQFTVTKFRYWWFQAQLLLISMTFHVTRAIQIVGELLTRTRWSGFEDVLEQQMINQVREKTGLIVTPQSFAA